MDLSRREVLKLGAGAALGFGIAARPPEAQAQRLRRRKKAAAAPKRIPIGLQLYSVRDDCAKDLPGVLEAVAKMGYQGVEFAGYYGRPAEQLRKLLDRNGLLCCGTHTGLDTLLGEAWPRTIEFNQTLGNKYLIVPGLPGKYLASKEAILQTARLFSELAAKAKPLGMYVGYHAHGGDFRKFDGQTAWDILFSNASPEVVMQLDIGNCLGAGGDPYAVLQKFPGRSKTVHLKEHGGKPGAAVGEGDVKWQEVFRLCETTGGTEWYIVEQESYDGPPLDCVRRCLENLRKMGKA
ncbi:MAG: sugar phosphate isomerase/epimerase family protein [Thermoguttaceae bacterium]